MFGFPEDWTFDVKFDVTLPGSNGNDIVTLNGLNSLDAAARCAHAVAATRTCADGRAN